MCRARHTQITALDFYSAALRKNQWVQSLGMRPNGCITSSTFTTLFAFVRRWSERAIASSESKDNTITWMDSWVRWLCRVVLLISEIKLGAWPRAEGRGDHAPLARPSSMRTSACFPTRALKKMEDLFAGDCLILCDWGLLGLVYVHDIGWTEFRR